MFRFLLPAISACVIVLLCAGTARAADAVETALPAPPGSEAEPNGTAATASPIQAGERIRATIYPAGDVDVYRFHAEAGDRVYATTVTSGSVWDTDTVMTLLGPDGATIESDNNDGSLDPTSSSLAGVAVPAAGTYSLEVKARQANQTIRPYDLYLDVRAGSPASEAEPNNTIDTANPLPGGVVAGESSPGDPDVYALQLGAGDTVFLSLDLDPDRDGATQNATLGFGLAGKIATVTNLRAADAGHSMAYAATAPAEGTYSVSVAGRGGAETTYALSATVIPAAKQSCRTYPLTPADGAIPDHGVATFPIDVADAATIGHVALATDLTHSYPPDLVATLESPNGMEVPVFGETGRGDPHMAVTWDDNAAQAVNGLSIPSQMLLSVRRGGLEAFEGLQAAGTWKLRLVDEVADDTGTLAHADLILCARPPAGPAETVFSASFEDGDDGFTHSGAGDEWQRGTPATPAGKDLAALDHCAGGTGCFKTDLDGTYADGSSQDLLSPPISLAGRSGPIVASWAMWYQLENATFDHATVSVEEDGGGNSRNLFTWLWSTAWFSLRDVRDLAYGIGWGEHRADISDYAGKTIRLRYHLDSDADRNAAGVAIDDVRVEQPKPGSAAPVDDPAPETTVPTATTPPPVTPAAPKTASADERALSRLKLAKSCVRPSRSGKSRITLTLGVAKPRPVQVQVERAVGSTARGTCWQPNADSPAVPLSTRWRPVTLMGAATAASVTRRMTFNVRLKPGLYRLTVRLVLENGKLSAPARRYLRVVAR